MSDPPELGRLLSRREFLRQAGVAGMATTVATVAYGVGRPPPDTPSRPAIPRLDVPGRISGIAFMGDRLVAVGAQFHRGAPVPAVWSYRLGGDSWTRSAWHEDFPPGTVLAAVTGISRRLVAVGHIRKLSRTETVVDDATGRLRKMPTESMVPAIFASGDAVTWEPVVRSVPGTPLGTFVAAAATRDSSQVLAIGSRCIEPGGCDGYGVMAVRSRDGQSWESTSLRGVAPPRHGSVTLLTSVLDITLLATRELRESSLYMQSGDRWNRIDVPEARASYVAAGPTDGSFVLAGIDDSARRGMWKRKNAGWVEIDMPPAIPGGGSLTDVEQLKGTLIGVGSAGEIGFVRDLGGAVRVRRHAEV